jgi:hypothetical protein
MYQWANRSNGRTWESDTPSPLMGVLVDRLDAKDGDVLRREWEGHRTVYVVRYDKLVEIHSRSKDGGIL